MIFYDFFTNYHKTKQLQNLWGENLHIFDDFTVCTCRNK